ncbi:helix-turn-helix domain-containing protein [Bacillus cereus]|uniref:Helix-turn-helix domain-containing protein n=1 Tax=Bacillus cereus TaxID=1396 RepID=A0AAW5KZS8_BACCE|nr:helix-turn-helix transcriptional regulator [Bacillus cereus]MCQ6284875.1 helix-turn-helix domain-containing protein [Bacillus cereus]MCQ6305925.1 helix-turn-helix domain-containing protein [Bacillus cereus]MCQ6313963.1 helix-turn-helix domain-containing protein [Bacillus cereus]MCQ6330330.1 helix-turn-helix domain-containing protein [Bacillus cereus]MCQ6381857.1 helix-turn-helix domain-containing protein [Bacillus cereus]
MDYKLISRRIKDIRTNVLQLSQREFAEVLGMQSRSAISMWENEDSKKCPSKRMSLKIAKLANISVSYVLGESNERNPELAAQDEWTQIMAQVKSKTPEKQKELLALIQNLVKITGD